MDRLKFRVWDKRIKRYYVPEYITCDGGAMPVTGGEGGERYDFCNESEYIIEQSTGLKDKNGNLIYEGDVVFYGEDISLPDEFVLIGVVKWSQEHGGWNVYTEQDICTLCDYIDEWEIIGNVNENPELLEQ